MENQRFNPEDRIREKQLAREQDERDLADGRVSRTELNERNSLFAGQDIKRAKMRIRHPLG